MVCVYIIKTEYFNVYKLASFTFIVSALLIFLF